MFGYDISGVTRLVFLPHVTDEISAFMRNSSKNRRFSSLFRCLNVKAKMKISKISNFWCKYSETVFSVTKNVMHQAWHDIWHMNAWQRLVTRNVTRDVRCEKRHELGAWRDLSRVVHHDFVSVSLCRIAIFLRIMRQCSVFDVDKIRIRLHQWVWRQSTILLRSRTVWSTKAR